MSAIEFQAWPKISRLYRPCVITEKIDGSNSAIGIKWVDFDQLTKDGVDPASFPREKVTAWVDNPEVPVGAYTIYAQSRSRIITPGKQTDNFGFAAWVEERAEALVYTLGEGLHFGEFWGSGIQRGYGLVKGEKRFSLFNTPRYTKPEFDLTKIPGLGTVPVLFHGMFSTHTVDHQVEILRQSGSVAAPGFMDPEGVVTFHIASGTAFKTTLKDDEKPKGSNELG